MNYDDPQQVAVQKIDLNFFHRFVPSTDAQSDITLLLLHGTGGNENDLLPLGRALLPGAALLSPRGKVLENGMPRFFRRFAEGVFDIDDLKFRTHELAAFIEDATVRYELKNNKLIAVGYSHGANAAASLILLHPHHLAAAVLFRPPVPFQPDILRDFSRLPVFIGAGRQDPVIGPDAPEQLAGILQSGGADVSLFWHAGGHELGQDDIDAARVWLTQQRSHWASPNMKAKPE